MRRLLILSTPATLGVATAVAAYANPLVALPLAFMTIAALAVVGLAFPVAALVSDESIDRLFDEEVAE